MVSCGVLVSETTGTSLDQRIFTIRTRVDIKDTLIEKRDQNWNVEIHGVYASFFTESLNQHILTIHIHMYG